MKKLKMEPDARMHTIGTLSAGVLIGLLLGVDTLLGLEALMVLLAVVFAFRKKPPDQESNPRQVVSGVKVNGGRGYDGHKDQSKIPQPSLNYIPLEIWSKVSPKPEKEPMHKKILERLQDAYREAIHEYIIPIVPILIAEAIIYPSVFFVLKIIFSFL